MDWMSLSMIIHYCWLPDLMQRVFGLLPYLTKNYGRYEMGKPRYANFHITLALPCITKELHEHGLMNLSMVIVRS